MATINISKSKIQKQGGLVILPLREYERLQESAIPTYYLSGKAAKAVDDLVKRGLQEYRAGRTISAPSLKEAMAKFNKK